MQAKICTERYPPLGCGVRRFGPEAPLVTVDITRWGGLEYEEKEACAVWISVCLHGGAEIQVLDSRTRRTLASYSPERKLRLE
jgi:hypothetical protein